MFTFYFIIIISFAKRQDMWENVDVPLVRGVFPHSVNSVRLNKGKGKDLGGFTAFIPMEVTDISEPAAGPYLFSPQQVSVSPRSSLPWQCTKLPPPTLWLNSPGIPGSTALS